ncbi:MAG: GH32 C-terminal domain-containing protein, partial [Phaeodactylibacter sp.]|nr:GH32 C-terminal domain-containing protein [Phaeodactylibacter sp.]
KFWGSPDLINWTHLSDFGREWGSHGGVWECPDLFPIQEENSGETKWVMLLSINPGGPNGGSATQYFVGHFDGKKFTLDPSFAPQVSGEKAVWLDYGPDDYAGVTWSDIPKADGRRIFLGWMSNWDYATVVPTETWRSAMTLPRKLTLKQTAAGLRLLSQPVKELESLRGEVFSLEGQTVERELDMGGQSGVSPSQMEVILEAELPEGPETDFGIALSNSKGEKYRIGYNAAKNEFYSDRTKAGVTGFSEKFAAKIHTAPRISTERGLRLHLFFDVASCEMFADGGEVVMTEAFFPSEDFSEVKLYSSGGDVKVIEARVYPLNKAVFR